jgi:cytosine deaminase
MGAEALLIQKGVEIIVVNNNECIEMMESFIKTNPELWNEDIGV